MRGNNGTAGIKTSFPDYILPLPRTLLGATLCGPGNGVRRALGPVFMRMHYADVRSCAFKTCARRKEPRVRLTARVLDIHTTSWCGQVDAEVTGKIFGHVDYI